MTKATTDHHDDTAPHDRRSDDAGFTWSEFTLVAVIVVVLIAAALWGLGGIREQTRDTRCESSLRSIKLATGEYQSTNGRYPVDNQALIDGGHVDPDEIRGHRVSLAPGGDEPVYTARGECE